VGLLIDTSVLVDVERGRVRLDPLSARRGDEPVFLSAITAAELLLGVRLAADARHRARRAAFVEHVLRAVPVLPIEVGIARVHAELAAAVRAAGTPVGAHDLWLAATAVAHGLVLATTNVRELERVPGLEVAGWPAGDGTVVGGSENPVGV